MENENKGFFSKLAGMIGKEVSEDIIGSLDKELEEFKNLIVNNQFLETIPNLEIETFEVSVTASGQTVNVIGKTKIEHDRILGLLIIPNAYSDKIGKIEVRIDRKYIVTEGKFYPTLIQKTDYLTVYESAWRLNIPINTSDIEINFYDSGASWSGAHSFNVYFICRKKLI